VGEAKVRHHAGAAEGDSFGRGEVGRKGVDLLDGGDRTFDVASAGSGEGPHAAAGPGRVDVLSDRGHDAGDLAAGDVALDEAVGAEGAPADDSVDATDADRLGRDQYLAASRDRLGNVDHLKALRASERLDHDRLHVVGR
jgi:hypothetical protein